MIDNHLLPITIAQINFTEIGSNLVAVIPYVLPLMFGGIMLLLFQRYLPRDEPRRNVILFVGIVGVVSAALLILYSGFGSMWWIPGELTFGSYDVFIAVLQRITMMAFQYSILYSLVYLIGTILIFTYMANYVISPPNPDFVKVQDEMKEVREAVESNKKEKQELEAENKRLNEFLKEKEETLTVLHSELDALKVSVGERESSITEMESRLRETPAPSEDSSAEQELLETISKKDQTISKLQSEIADMRLILEGSETQATPPAATEASADVIAKVQQLEAQLQTTNSKLADYGRRADTAGEVSDSVISDLAELIAQVESSALDGPTKKAVNSLIEGLGRAMGRISSASADKDDSPKVELIGAIMMVHEIVDGVKKLSRA
ncbi:MAG: hypothetical protein ACW98Y_02500 [Candidatus Thorarchaeota archaeon]